MEPFCVVTYVILHLLIAIVAIMWVHNDAEERGRNGCLWALLVFFLGIPGIIVWLVIREELGQGGYRASPSPPATKPAQTRGGYAEADAFYREISRLYLQLKQRNISEVQFQEEKARAIEALKGKKGASPEDYVGRLVSFIESGILTEDDVAQIKENLTMDEDPHSKNKRSQSFIQEQNPPQKAGFFDQQQLIADYLRSSDPAMEAELAANNLPVDADELVKVLDTTRLIDLYRETGGQVFAAELRRRGMEQFL